MTDGDARARASLAPLAYASLTGWAADDHRAALTAFGRGAAVLAEHPPKAREIAVDPAALARRLREAEALARDIPAGVARAFFEEAFEPREILPAGSGFFTGYYEPIVAGSRVPTDRFRTPLYRAPDDLVEIDPENPPPGLPPGFRFARKTPAGLTEHPDRAAIMDGFLAGRGLELVWLADPVDAFFVHIQGAARVRLTDGSTLRVTYAAKTGHPYTAVGKVLVERGALTLASATMAGIRGWLAAHPADAAAVMAKNRSFIFFREAPAGGADDGPVAAAKVALTAGRSLAVDRLLHSFHLPVWIETTLPDGKPWRRLMVAQDTGSAIIGPGRGDIFFGSGDEAGAVAGAMRAAGRFIVLVPRP